MENLRFTIAAAETKRYETAGRYLEIIDATGPVTLTLYGPDGGVIDTARDILSGTYCAAPFAAFTVTSATAQTVELFTAAIEAGTKRQPGVVAVIDGERAKVLSGNCFRGVGSVAGGGAGGALVQLMNPAGSGRNAFVQAVRLGASAADTWSIITTTTQAPTLIGAAPNLDRTQAASAAAMRTGNDATAYAGQLTYAIGYTQANADLLILFPRPVVVRPGQGLYVQMTALATNLRGAFEWEEWPI